MTVVVGPFFRRVEVSRNEEARDGIVGYDLLSRLLYVVHVEVEGDAIRIISARKATNKERKHYDS